MLFIASAAIQKKRVNTELLRCARNAGYDLLITYLTH